MALLRTLLISLAFSVLISCGGGSGGGSGGAGGGNGGTGASSSSSSSSVPDPDLDGDGVPNAEDAFPNDPTEWADLDDDGIGDNSDEDIDGDGIANDLDAFPTDATESQDSDADGVGDNGDAYPNQSACSALSDGNGSECYITWLATQEFNQIVAGADGLVFFHGIDWNFILSYQSFTGSFSKVENVGSDSDRITKIAFSESHSRLYVGHTSGLIGFYDIESQTYQRDFAFTDEQVDGLTSVGNFVLAQDNSGAWESHYIFDQNGQQTDWVDWNHYSRVYAWNNDLDRVYFFRDTTSPNDLMYQDIDQQTGQVIAEGETSYHGTYEIRPPIKLSRNNEKLILGSGDIYDPESLDLMSSIGTSFDDATWLEDGELVTATQSDDIVLLRRYSTDLTQNEARSYTGRLAGVYSWEDGTFLVTVTENQLNFHEYSASDDSDGDGVPNNEDDFPNDVAASQDTDGDGYPTSWNQGYSQEDSTTGLILDAFAQDSACFLPEHGVGGVCDISAQTSISNVIELTEKDGLIYALSSVDSKVYRWRAEDGEYLNPLILPQEDFLGQPTSLAVTAESEVLVGFHGGALIGYPEDNTADFEWIQIFASGVSDLVTVQTSTVAIVGGGDYSRDYFVLDADFNLVNGPYDGPNSSDYQYNSNTNRLYWFSDTYSNNLISAYINPQSSEFEDYQYFYFDDYSSPSFMAVSEDASLIVTGTGKVVRNLGDSPTLVDLPQSASLGAEASLVGFVWLSDLGVALYTLDSEYFLVGYGLDLTSVLFDYALDHELVHEIRAFGAGISLLVENNNTLSFTNLDLLSDADQDGLPSWWELAFGLNDQDASDALADPDGDGLANSEEFVSRTSPLLADTDGDGLNDSTELSLSLNPLAGDTDGDLMPDLWEVEYGLDGTDPSDAEIDSDNDGAENYYEYMGGTDPTDELSVPEYISNTFISFEDGEIPDTFSLSGEIDRAIVDDRDASDGSYSLLVEGSIDLSWIALFEPVEVSFYAKSTCYDSYDSELIVELNGVEQLRVNPSQANWQKISVPVQKGYQDLQFQINNYSYADDCGMRLDAFTVSPLQSVFREGISSIAQHDGQLLFLNSTGETMRSVAIPFSSDYHGARDIAVLDDGRIAVFNGTFSPVLSVYTPEDHSWTTTLAPAWSTINNLSFGGIDAIGNRIFATNMSTSGNPTSGIVVFDLDNETVEYIEVDGLEDLTVGFDGYLYGLSGSAVRTFDPSDFSLLSEIEIGSARSIAVSESSEIFAADWSGKIRHHASGGLLLKEISLEGSFTDIALRQNGWILVSGEYNDRIIETSVDLQDFSEYQSTGRFVDFVPDIDSDEDGLPDWWESANGLDLDDPSDSSIDQDSDGLAAADEYAIRTDAADFDTDGDGLSDGEEYLTVGSNPLKADTDQDGLPDGDEVAAGTDPTSEDSDSDGLSDYDEINFHSTDPLSVDSDNDGMADNFEVVHELNPTVDDSGADSDSDGLTNLEEYQAGTNPQVSDTDGDGISDGDELNNLNTSPLLSDTDGDRIPDGWEIESGFDANDPSTASLDEDADGFSNYEEFLFGSDPNSETSFPQPIEWVTHQGDSSHSGYTPHVLDESLFTFKWERTFEGVSELNPVVAAAGQVFVSSNEYFGDSQVIQALNSDSGDTNWELNYAGIHSINAPAFNDGQVFFQTGGHEDSFLRSVDASSGELVWQSAYGNQWSRYLAPTVFDGGVYIGGGYYDGVYAFDKESGVEEWFYGGPQHDEFTPAVDNDYVYVFTMNLDVFNRTTGLLEYTVEFPSFDWRGWSVGTAPVLTPLRNIVGVQQGTLVVFDLEDRSILWEKVAQGFSGQPTVADDQIYTVYYGDLQVIDEITGDNIWRWESAEELTSNIVVTKTHVFVGNQANTFCIDRQTQDVVWSYPAAGHLSISAEGELYISGQSLVSIALK